MTNLSSEAPLYHPLLRPQEPIMEGDDFMRGCAPQPNTEITPRPRLPRYNSYDSSSSVSDVKAEKQRDREAFSFKNVRLSMDGVEVICSVAGPDGYHFTLLYNNGDIPAPVFTLRYHHGSSELVIKSPIVDGRGVPGRLVAEFLETALAEIKGNPREISLNIKTANLTDDQIRHVSGLDFKMLTTASPEHHPSEVNHEPHAKQEEYNREFIEAEREFAHYQRRETLEDKPHAEWLRLANILLHLAIIKEGKDGIEAARDYLEATREYFAQAIKTLPSEILEVGIDILSQIKYAGVLARLSSCVDLEGYDKQKYPDLRDNDRNDDLFNKSIRIYKELKVLIGRNGSDRNKSLVVSGLAEAHTLRAAYINRKKRSRDGLGRVISIDSALRTRAQRHAKRQATEEIKEGSKDIKDADLLRKLSEQLGEVGTSESSLQEGVPEGEDMRAADRILLTAA